MPNDITRANLEAAGFEALKHPYHPCFALTIQKGLGLDIVEMNGEFRAWFSVGKSSVLLTRRFTAMSEVLELVRVLRGDQ
jgi:hypothetical protein